MIRFWHLAAVSGAVNSIQKEYEGHDDDDDDKIFLEYFNVIRRQ